MPIDIFPEINIPVVTVIWQYTGLSTPEMEQRVTTYSQYAISTAVSGIKNMEAQTLNGISVQRIFFQPDVNIDLAVTQIVSATNFIRQLLPPGIQAPLVVNYDASSIPVLQLSLDSDNLNEQQLYDYGYYNLRQRLAPVHGVTLCDARLVPNYSEVGASLEGLMKPTFRAAPWPPADRACQSLR
jgi:multidrug efflux pump subunit AcrB